MCSGHCSGSLTSQPLGKHRPFLGWGFPANLEMLQTITGVTLSFLPPLVRLFKVELISCWSFCFVFSDW